VIQLENRPLSHSVQSIVAVRDENVDEPVSSPVHSRILDGSQIDDPKRPNIEVLSGVSSRISFLRGGSQ